jgi:hypothetical protein
LNRAESVSTALPYTGPTARPLGVAVLVIAVLDEPLPAVA